MTGRSNARDLAAAVREVALAGVLLAVLIAAAMASPARAIHRGDDAPFSSYRFMVSLRLAGMPDSPGP